jgi:FKBP-type peptidyl-prolyl cis-trans isomerase
MWVKNSVKFVLVLQIALLAAQVETRELPEDSEELPSIWEDEAVTKMMRDVLAADLAKEHDTRRLRRQHKRDVQSAQTLPAAGKAQTTRKASTTAQKTKKPPKVTTAGSKSKIRVTAATSSAATKATVKPSSKPIVTVSGATGINALSTLKAKVS